MNQEKHNQYCKLIETNIYNGINFLTLVYAIENNGDNEGLEVYYKKENDGHFYTSRRWLSNAIPNCYKRYFNALKEQVSKIKDGHKAVIDINTLLGH